MNQADVRDALLLRPRDAFMLTLKSEAAGDGFLSQVGVACCIRNRALHPRWWGKDYASVCLKSWQFSAWWTVTAPNSIRLYADAVRILIGDPAPRSEASIESRLYSIVDSVMAGTKSESPAGTDDNTNSADHYLTHYLLATAPPKWALTAKPCAHIGSHSFFRLEI